MAGQINGRNARQKKKKVNVDMNPMVDLAFLLLTFFMMATTFSKPQAMELIMPLEAEKEEEQQVIPESKVLSIVLADSSTAHFYLGVTEPEVQKVPYSADSLGKMLKVFHDIEPELMVLIKPTSEASYAQIVDLLDELNQLKMTKYVLMDPNAEDMAIIEKEEE